MKQVTQFGHYIFIYSIVQQYLVQEIFGQGQCSFDSKWMDLWWRQYDGSTSITQKFTNAGKITIKNGATTKSYTCNGIESENLGFNYIRNEDGKADKECAYGYVTQTTKTTFVEQVAALPSAASSAGPRDCTPYLQNAPVNVMINAKFNFNQSACSVIPLGMYNVAYYENSATKMCDGDDTSRMTVTANEIKIATCTKTGTYEKPYVIKLKCVDYLKANILGYDESKGNVMILAFEDLFGKQKFYCAKYSTDVPNRKVYMSLHINQGEGVKCQKDQDSKKAGDQYRAFEMQLNHCLSVPCKNNGNCTDLWQAYICSCLPGFTGQQCETNIDECSSQPCMNGATCMDEINEYKCQCPPDYTGVHCDKELCSLPMEWNSTGPFWQQYNTVNSGISLKSYSKIDTKISTLTPPSPLNSILFCQSNSTVGDYTYFTSTQITKPLPQVDFCTENKLVGNFMLHREKQTATLQTSSATCPTVLGSRVKTSVYVKYPFDFSSFNCPFPSATYQFAYSEDGNIDTCSSNMASAAEVAKNINIKGCFTGTASYKKPFNGEIECVGNLTAAEFDAPGSSNPDVLILAQKDESSSYRFYCARYKIVDTKIILSLDVSNKEKLACRSDKTHDAALNDQFVKLTLSSMECSKVPGPCLNNGTCNQKLAAYTCTCQPGFTGTNCETNIDECVSQPCQNGGTCVDDINSYNCTCSNNFIGTHCETPNNCWNSPCQNGGTCQEITGDYQCKCAPGYEGKNCSINTDECKSNPCQNGGTCNDFINGYNCTCKVGTTGPNCESDFDECLSGPCQNGGTCHDRINGYICRCPKTHIGTHCESINECYPQPCLNGATCVDDHLFYKCNCTDGYTGKDCESNVDDCAGAPCKNNATCIDGLNGFTCKCAKGFLGRLCDTEINACLSSPCVHGRCENRLGGYICRCPSGYYGEKCQLQSPLKLEADIITVIILSIFAVVSVAVIIVALIMLHYRRRRRQAKEKYLMGASNGVAASQTNSVKSAKSWYPDYGKDSVNSPYNSPNSAL